MAYLNSLLPPAELEIEEAAKAIFLAPPAYLARDAFNVDGILVPGNNKRGQVFLPKCELVKHDSPFILNGEEGDASEDKRDKMNWPMADFFNYVSMTLYGRKQEFRNELGFANLLKDIIKNGSEGVRLSMREEYGDKHEYQKTLELFHQFEEALNESAFVESGCRYLYPANFPLR